MIVLFIISAKKDYRDIYTKYDRHNVLFIKWKYQAAYSYAYYNFISKRAVGGYIKTYF